MNFATVSRCLQYLSDGRTTRGYGRTTGIWLKATEIGEASPDAHGRDGRQASESAWKGKGVAFPIQFPRWRYMQGRP
jgi:hypothetical protein